REPEPFVSDTLGTMGSPGAGKGLGTFRGGRMRGPLAWSARRAYYLLTMPGGGRRVRILAAWAGPLVTHPDTGRIDLEAEASRQDRERRPAGPPKPAAAIPAPNQLVEENP